MTNERFSPTTIGLSQPVLQTFIDATTLEIQMRLTQRTTEFPCREVVRYGMRHPKGLQALAKHPLVKINSP